MRLIEQLYDALGDEVLARRMEVAMWAGDCDTLHEIADCNCCCGEHTSPCCVARLWGGCRSNAPYGWGPAEEFAELEAWIAHYARFHGMSRETFLGEP